MLTLKSFREVVDSLVTDESKAIEYFFDINYDISELLVSYRIDHDMTQKQLADMLGVSQVMVSKYENGDYNFTLKKICEICEALEYKPNVAFNPLGVGEIGEDWKSQEQISLTNTMEDKSWEEQELLAS